LSVYFIITFSESELPDEKILKINEASLQVSKTGVNEMKVRTVDYHLKVKVAKQSINFPNA